MTFSSVRLPSGLSLVVCTIALFGLGSCNRAASREQKALRAELTEALRTHSYEKATELARRMLALDPRDDGNWDRLIQAQFGTRDFAGIKQTLEDWRRNGKSPPTKLDEYAGDLAAEMSEPAAAVQAWRKVLAAEPKNTRVLEKVADMEKVQQHWAEENEAWNALIAVQESAVARINRALCRRRLHRWHEAFDDLQKAQELAPDDPEVQRGGKILGEIGRYLPDIRELDASLALSPDDSGLLADRALLFLRSEDYELALEDAEAAARSGPWAMRPRLFQAIALLNLGRGADCQKLAVIGMVRVETLGTEFLETIGRLDSEISAERNNAELYVSRGWQLNEIGQPLLALEDAETAGRLDPKLAGAFAEQSYALMKLGRAAEALKQIRHATQLDPKFFTAWHYRGELEMARGETLSAIESFSHVIEGNPTPIALEKREQCYRRLGLLVKADQDRRALDELNKGTAK